MYIYIYISFCIVPQTIQQTFARHRSAKKSCLVHKTAFWKLTKLPHATSWYTRFPYL